MNATNETLLYPFYLPLRAVEFWERQWRVNHDVWLRFEQFFEPLWKPRVRHASTMRLHKGKVMEFERLMSSVKKGAGPGEYIGATMTRRRTRRAAKASGDFNPVHLSKPHPRFGKLIAHGMDGVTQAFAALRQELRDTNLVPARADIEFKSPVFLEEDTLHRILVVGNPDLPLVRTIEVWARSKKSNEERLVILITTYLEEDPEFADEDWIHVLVAAWRISALLAKTWKECLYVKQILHFEHPGQRPVRIEVAAEAKELTEKGHLLVKTHSHAGEPHKQIAHGIATIIPKKKKAKK